MMSSGHLQLTLDRIQAIRNRFEKPATVQNAGQSDVSFESLLQSKQAQQAQGNQRAELLGLIQNEALGQNLDPALVEAVVQAESGFNPKAVSPAGALGLMQLMPGTARELGVDNPMDPEQNVAGGTRYLKRMIDRFDSVPLGLAAYNAGPGAVKKHGGVPPYAETTNYVNKILRQYEANKTLNGGGNTL